jgi:hypothetical protein
MAFRELLLSKWGIAVNKPTVNLIFMVLYSGRETINYISLILPAQS